MMNLRPKPTDEQQTKLAAIISGGLEEAEAVRLFKSVFTVRAGAWVVRDPLEEVIKREGVYWVLYSHEGKRLYKARTKKAVLKREEQINFFKHDGEPATPESPQENNVMADKIIEPKEQEESATEYAPWGVYSFADLLASREAMEKADKVSEMTEDFVGLLWNIVSDPMVEDKYPAMEALMNEFSQIMQSVMVEQEPAETENPTEETEETEPEPVEQIAESFDGAIMDSEFAEVSANPMYMDVRIIKPGWGNKRDNHFYPKEMLARDAVRFQGAKMFETDHRDDEKSTRTWVSTIQKIAGFDEDGSPIARVVVHDPNFAQRVTNLKAAGMLEKMECSIAAMGKMKPGYEADGRRGSVVESITDVQSVDWVTKAGAGGAAVGIEESDAEPTEPAQVEETIPTPEIEPVKQEEQPTEPMNLESGAVVSILESSRLPQAARVRFADKAWQNANELNAAIEQEIAYIKELTHSGEVTGLGASSRRKVDLAEIDKRKDEAVRKILGG